MSKLQQSVDGLISSFRNSTAGELELITKVISWCANNLPAAIALANGQAAVVPLQHEGYPLSCVDYEAKKEAPIPTMKPMRCMRSFQLEMVRMDVPPAEGKGLQ